MMQLDKAIRAYTQDELPQIFNIYACSKLDELRFEDKPFTLIPLDKDERRLSGLMESEIYVYQQQDTISGFGAICGNEIRALFVHPKYRGQGIGKALIEFLLSKTQEQPYLYVARTNQPAKDLYTGYGFSVTDTFATEYNQQPVVAQKMVRMAVT